MPCCRLLLVALLLFLAVPRLAGGQTPPGAAPIAAPSTEPFSLRYDRAEIADVVREVAEKARVPFSFDERLRGKVTITAPRPVTPDEALQLLATALRTVGFTVVRTGAGLHEIVPIPESVGRVEVSASTPRAFVDLPVTTLAPLRAAKADALVPVVQPLLGANAVVQAFTPTNTLILSATEGQIHRALIVLRALDRAEERKLLVLRSRFREADDLLPLVQATFPESRRASESLRIVSETRSNALLVEGPPDLVAEVRDFVRTLDVPAMGEGRVQVVRLHHADAEELAEVLQQAAQAPSTPRGPAQGTVEDDVAAAAGDVLAGHDFSLAADPGTNSLVIRADRETFRLLGEIIAALDVDAPSVSVKATLLEIEGNDSLDVAIDTILPFTRPATPSDGNSFVRLLNSGDPSLLGTQPRDGDESFVLRFLKDPATFTRTGPDGTTVTETVPSYGVDVKAQATGGTTNLLSEPHLVARSGEEQELFIGNNIPIPSAAQTSASDGTAAVSDVDTLSVSQTIERQDVGIQLRIKPNVPIDGPVRLELRLEFTALTASVTGDVTEVGPTLLKQSVESTVYLADGAGAVIGVRGQPSQEILRTGTPWLMDVPGLGWLFSSVREEVIRRDLVLAVQVKVLRTAADLESESIRRRIALERSVSGLEHLPVSAGEAPFAVWVSTEESRAAGEALAAGLDVSARRTEVVPWRDGEPRRFDVYLLGFDRYADAAEACLEIRSQGFEPEVVALPEGAD